MKKQFEYSLNNPISVSSNGEQIECSDIVVKGPRPKDSMTALVFESLLGKALMSFSGGNSSNDAPAAAKPDNEDENEKIRGWEMLLVSSSTSENLRSMVFNLKELMCEGNLESPQATIGGVKFTKPLFDELSHKDIKSLLARYACYFLFSDLI